MSVWDQSNAFERDRAAYIHRHSPESTPATQGDLQSVEREMAAWRAEMERRIARLEEDVARQRGHFTLPGGSNEPI
jgi:hypothetical protein